jgi:hypothetical protein
MGKTSDGARRRLLAAVSVLGVSLGMAAHADAAQDSYKGPNTQNSLKGQTSFKAGSQTSWKVNGQSSLKQPSQTSLKIDSSQTPQTAGQSSQKTPAP